MENFVIILIVIAIVFLSSFYIYRSKKLGKKCIGCPCAGSCGKNQCDCEK